jgi:uncharacterized protein YegL
MLEKNDKPQLDKETIRAAMEVASYVSDLGIKVLPGKSWTPYYPESSNREQILQKVLDGKLKPEAVDVGKLRPHGMTYDVRDVQTIGLNGLVGKIRERDEFFKQFDYSGYVEFLAGLKGKEIDLKTATELFEGMAKPRIQESLLERSGPTGRSQITNALKGEIQTIKRTIKDKSRIERLSDILRMRWLKDKGIATEDDVTEIEKAAGEDSKKLADELGDPYLEYVKKGDKPAKKSIIDKIKSTIKEITKQKKEDDVDKMVDQAIKNPSSLPPETRDQIGKAFNDFSAPQGDIPPDSRNTMSPSMDETKEVGDKQEVVPLYSITPPYKGLLQGQIFNRFNSSQVEWQKNDKYTKVDDGDAPKQHTIKGKINGGSMITIFLPRNYALSQFNLPKGLKVFKDENGTFYLQNTSGKILEYELGFGPKPDSHSTAPLPDEVKDMAGDRLSQSTKNYLKTLDGKSNVEKAKGAIHYMKNVLKLEYSNDSKYNLIYKRNPSQYFLEIEKNKQVDCDVAQTYFIALCRSMGVPARMVTGHSVDLVKDGKSIIHSGTGHAWSEIWDNQSGAWKTIDATPEKTGKDDKKDENKPKSKPEDRAKEAKTDLDAPNQNPRDGDEPPSNEEVQKNIDDTVERTEKEGSDSSETSDQMPQSAKDKMEEVMEQQDPPQDKSNQMTDNEWDEKKKEQEEMDEKDKEMKKEAEEMKDKIKDADSLRDLRQLEEELKDKEIYDDAKENLENLLEQKEEEAKNELKEQIEKMRDDGFISEEKAEKMLQDLENNDSLRTFEGIEGQLSRESSLYNEYAELRDEVMPLVEQWVDYFADKLPKISEIDFSDEDASVRGRLSKFHMKRPRNFVLGRVNKPQHETQSKAPRFMVSLVLDISGSMRDKMRNARKLLIFFAELFQKISNEYGYIKFSISVFDDDVQVIKGFDQKYDSTERYIYGNQERTVKVRLMERTMADGGTDMGKAVWEANHKLNIEKATHEDYLSALYLMSDGETQGTLAGQQLRRFIAGEQAFWGEWWGDHLKRAFMLGPRTHKAVLAQYFGEENADAVPDM